MAVFAGLDGNDWAAMEHAYGSAEAAVAAAHPLFLELLADADPSVREQQPQCARRRGAAAGLHGGTGRGHRRTLTLAGGNGRRLVHCGAASP